MSKDPRGRLFHCPFQVYGKKDPEKTRRKVPNLNAVKIRYNNKANRRRISA